MKTSKVLQLMMVSWVVAAAILYLIASFVAVSFNVAEWEPFGRFLIAGLWLFYTVVSICVASAYLIDEQSKLKKNF